jgi:phosphatidylserine/phosphatidylglycerophosphate/cardiolipin synthase-like enzyme
MTPELMQWLIPIASAIAGMFIRHWFPNAFGVPPTPATPPTPTPGTADPGKVLEAILATLKAKAESTPSPTDDAVLSALDLIRKRLAVQPPQTP